MTPTRRLSLLAAVALLLLLACSPASAALKKKFKPLKRLSTITRTTKLSALRSATLAQTRTWQSGVVKKNYDQYVKLYRKPAFNVNSVSKQTTFTNNLAKIVARNTNTRLRWSSAPNVFTDMTTTERARFLGARRRRGTKALVAQLASTVRTPAQILADDPPKVAPPSVEAAQLLADVPDWSPALPDVKNQGNCGSCWAFATTSLVEAGHYINVGQVRPLSEKQLVDCDSNNGGCDGGWYDAALQYVIDNGLATADDYPYQAVKGTCPAELPPAASRLASYRQLPAGNEAAMLEALKEGPLAVAVTVDDAFMDYMGGVFQSTTCGGDVNHAVVLIGAGVDEETQIPYWVLRNSWGPDWGEGGYMRIQRNAGGNGMCNVAAAAFSAISADVPPNDDPSPPPPDNDDNDDNPDDTPVDPPEPPPGCQAKTVTWTSSMDLAQVARGNGVSIAQVMLDNKLNVNTPIRVGQQLTVNCAAGTWSPPYGIWQLGQAAIYRQGMTAMPTVQVCPAGTFIVSFYMKPSRHFTPPFDGTTWIGTIEVTCSDNTVLKIDAQSLDDPGFANGTETLMTGFTNATLTSGWALDSLFGVGQIAGGEPQAFNCPENTLITGISAGACQACGGASPPKGFISTLQFFCQNPYGNSTNVARVRRMRSFALRFNRMRNGLSCRKHKVVAGDTWASVASKYPRTNFIELMRANPAITGTTLPVGQVVFIPPCFKGVVEGTKIRKSAGPAFNAQDPVALSAAAADLVAHPEVPARGALAAFVDGFVATAAP